MKKLKLVLDFTVGAKDAQRVLAEEPTYAPLTPPEVTTLLAYYPNGEHCATFPERRNPKAGRKAAKTFMKYCDCDFEDRTR